MKRLMTALILFLIFGISYFFTSWNAGFLALEDNWKTMLTFTPETVTDPQQIYEIDKFIYAFGVQPILTTVFFLSSICLVAFFGIQLYRFVKKNKNNKFSIV